MKKIVKASIATGAGIMLLVGGAGTFATWNSSATVGGSNITAGNLVVEDTLVAGTWKANGSSVESIGGYRIVPGDELTYTKTLEVTAEGDSLTATLDLSDASIVAADLNDAADVALAGYLDETAVLEATGTGITENEDGTFTVTPGADTASADVTVTVTLTFPEGALAANNNAMLGAVTLEDLEVTLTQVVDTAPVLTNE